MTNYRSLCFGRQNFLAIAFTTLQFIKKHLILNVQTIVCSSTSVLDNGLARLCLQHIYAYVCPGAQVMHKFYVGYGKYHSDIIALTKRTALHQAYSTSCIWVAFKVPHVSLHAHDIKGTIYLVQSIVFC